MPDLSDLLRQSVTRAATAYEPSASLPQRIARRTLQLQRRRRARIVGGAAILTVAVLAVPVVVPSRDRSNSVGVGYEPVRIIARHARVGATPTTSAPVPILDLQGFIDRGIEERNKALKRFAAAVKKARDNEAAKKRRDKDALEVLGALKVRGGRQSTRNDSPGATTGTTDPDSSSTTKKPSTTTTKKPTTTTTDPPTTTTTDPPPPPTTQPTTPIVPLKIVGPTTACAGVPTVFEATGTGAEFVLWSNLQVGAQATYTFTENTTVKALLAIKGAQSAQSIGVQVFPAGTPPC
jgi:hypothetical protein